MELSQLLRTLRRRWKFITASLLLGILGAYVFTSTITPMYQSKVRVYITATSQGTLDAYNLSIYSSQRVISYGELAKDPSLLERVITRSGSAMTPEQLASRVSATAVPNTAILEIAVKDPDPRIAQDLADAEAKEIVKLVATLEAPAKGPDGEEPPSPIVARQASPSSFNGSAVSPTLMINLIVGGILGLLVGVAGGVLRDLFDTSIKTPQDLAEVTDAAVMATVRFDSSVPKHPLISDPESSIDRVEAFSVLRTNLQFVELDTKRQVLMISSALPNEGKTVTATNLAITLAQTGRRVLILDADFRKPRVARLLGLENSVGVLTVLVGRASVQECIQQHESGVDFLATGPTPPNPAEVLETQAMRDLLAEVRSSYDVVIVDAPPLLPVADPAIIAPLTDGVLLVTRYAKTDKALVQQSVDRLSAVRGRVVGVVINMTPRRAVWGDGYGYGEGYGYGDKFEESRASVKSKRAVRGVRRRTQHERVR